MELENRVAMISGGSKGLGAALARRFAEEGAAVSICARNEAALEAVAAGVRDLGAECVAVPADVTDAGAVERWIAATLDAFGKVDAFINNASVLGPRVTIEAYPEEAWRKVLEVNLTGAFLCARAVLPALRETDGSLVNVSSGVGDHGRPRWGAY